MQAGRHDGANRDDYFQRVRQGPDAIRPFTLLCRENPHAPLRLGPVAGAGAAQIVIGLQVHPQFWRRPEILAEPERNGRRDTRTSMHDVVDARRIHVDVACQPVLADAVRLHEFLGEYFAGRDRIELLCAHESMLLQPRLKTWMPGSSPGMAWESHILRSFPRKRESRAKEWVPAFAGTSGRRSPPPWRLAPAAHARFAQRRARRSRAATMRHRLDAGAHLVERGFARLFAGAVRQHLVPGRDAHLVERGLVRSTSPR